jgi:hypothetical protein
MPWVALAAVLVLAMASGGDWLVGERGVLNAPPPRPMRTAQAMAVGAPWLAVLVALRGCPRPLALLALLPLLLAPPDVPVVLILAAELGLRCAEQPGEGRPVWPAMARAPMWLIGTLAGGQLLLGVWAQRIEGARVAHEARVVSAVASQLTQEDAVLAPWTWGVRISIATTGDPYGLRWRSSGVLLPRQRAVWCAPSAGRVAVLPPSPGAPHTDALGVGWWDAADPRLASLPGCPAPDRTGP